MSTHDTTPENTAEEKKVHHHHQVHGSAEQDRAEGKADQLKGRLKESAGALTGNEDLRAEGLADQAHGHTKDTKGKVKENIKNIIDRA